MVMLNQDISTFETSLNRELVAPKEASNCLPLSIRINFYILNHAN